MKFNISLGDSSSKTILSPEQEAIKAFPLTNPHDNLVIEGVAGCGKSTMLIILLTELVNKLKLTNPRPRICITVLAFNSKIKSEMQSKVSNAMLDEWIEVMTLNAMGWKVCRRQRNVYAVNKTKLRDIVSRIVKEKNRSFTLITPLVRLVTLAKDSLIGVNNDINDNEPWNQLINFHGLEFDADTPLWLILKIAQESLAYNNNLENFDKKTMFDYGDQIYMPLLKGWRFDFYDYILVDEAQDVNASKIAMLKALAAAETNNIESGEVTKPIVYAVGDRRQAIYGFTGSLADGLDQLKVAFNAKELPLSYTWRCDEAIVKSAQTIVPQIKPRPNAGPGKVMRIPMADFELLVPGTPIAPEIKKPDLEDLKSTDMILCRNNAPNVELAFSLIRRGFPCRIEGKDIGQDLKKYLTRWKIFNLKALSDRLYEFIKRERDKAEATGDDSKIATLEDQCLCLQVLIDRCLSLGRTSMSSLEEMIDEMFTDSVAGVPQKLLTLSSIHKAKGLEAERVFILGANAYMPSRYARQPWQLEQEDNLRYVAITRAKKVLVWINVNP